MRRCADVAADVLPHPLLEVVDGRGGTEGLLDRIEYAQPALYALQCALVAVWRGWGIEPAAVAGHSMGEYAAAQAAGVFDLADGMRLALERGTRLAALPEGGMRVCFAAVSAVSAALDDLPGVTIAAINAPRNVVVAGSPQDLQRAAEVLAGRGIDSRPLTVDHAYHSPHTDAVLDGFHRAAATFTYAKPQLPFVSSVTGGHVDVELTGADYWTRHIRQPVRFAGAVQTLLDAGVDAFVEIGPKAALVGLARASAAEHRVAAPPAFTACLREAGADARTMRDAAGVLVTSGSVLRWDRIGPGGSPFADLPPHAFQRQAFWLGQSPAGGNGSVAAARGPATDRHPLLGARLRLAGAERRYEVEVAAHRPGYLRDHQVAGAVVLPGSALVEMLLVAAREQAPAMPLDLVDVALRRPVVLPETGLRTLQTHVAAGSAEIFSLGEDGQWASVAAAALGGRGPAAAPPSSSLREIGGGAQGTTSLQAFDVEAYYDHYLAGGLAYGPDFRSITHLAARPGSSEADLGLPPGVDGGDHLLHPVLLDGALQAIGAGLPEGDTRVWVPAGIGRVHLVQPAATTARARIAVSGDPSGDVLHADIVLTDVDGDLIAMLRDVRLAPAGTGALGGASTPDVRRWLYAVDHRPAVRRRPPAPLRLPAPAQVRDGLQAQLAALRDREDLVRHGAALARLDAMVPPLVASAVERLGWVEDQTISTAEELRERLGVHDRHRRLWPRLLGHLADAGGLVRTDAGYAVDAAGMAALRAQRAARGDAADVVTGAPAEAAILQRCGDGLAEALTGQVDPLHLLFGDGDTGSPAALYARSAGYRAMNRLVRTAVADLVADLAPGAGVRILEVGGGTGGTTAHVLPILPAEATEYVFTDISPHFLSRARTLFAAHPFLRTDLLDIAEDPQLQGQHAGRYDLIIAANVLHAT
ncbi:MAG TPA: acyltransferase domain-containing protein, partial [Euzebya sp.]|nr:acyltransferase domain-containing protein [Euzebya sp.]